MEDEDKNEFKTVWTNKGHSFKKQPQFSGIMTKCVQIQSELTLQFFNELINSITRHCHDRFNHGVVRLIVTVQFRRNQIDELSTFISRAADIFQQKKHQLFHEYPPSKVEVIYMGKCEVREIVLAMYIYLQDHPQLDLVVFIVNEITDLDEYNMYCFQKGLKGKNLVLIISSYHNFENTTENNTQQFQKYHFQLYNSKQLFCQYFYRCMISSDIKPYLPSEVLTLISDMNYYSISYHQSCRRFRYCLERSLMLYKKERTYVEFQRLIKLIDKSVIRQWKIYEGGRKPIPREKILKIILTEKQSFFISERFLALEIAMRASSPKDYLLQQENIIITIKERLQDLLKKDQMFRKYLPYLEDKNQTQHQEKGYRKKKTRFEQLGIESGKNLSPKQKLDSQITRIIKDATASIRQQASFIKWDDLKYQLRIKPQIPNLIKQAWHRDDDTAELVQEITQNYSMPLTNYLKFFEDEDWGKGIYLLKCLQLAGLIEISKRSIKPIVYTQYFDKATYALKQNK